MNVQFLIDGPLVAPEGVLADPQFVADFLVKKSPAQRTSSPRAKKQILSNSISMTESSFMSDSLTELLSAKMYVIHNLQLAADFFHSATSLAEQEPAFVQSLHKMKPHFLAAKLRIYIGFIGDFHIPSDEI